MNDWWELLVFLFWKCEKVIAICLTLTGALILRESSNLGRQTNDNGKAVWGLTFGAIFFAVLGALMFLDLAVEEIVRGLAP